MIDMNEKYVLSMRKAVVGSDCKFIRNQEKKIVEKSESIFLRGHSAGNNFLKLFLSINFEKSFGKLF